LVLENGARNSSIRGTYEIRDLGVVQNIAAGLAEGFNEGNVVSCIIKLTIGIRHGANQPLWVQLRHALKSFLSRQ
jgi:hypothetical protein